MIGPPPRRLARSAPFADTLNVFRTSASCYIPGDEEYRFSILLGNGLIFPLQS
jgi:hypothetical protein